MAIIKDIQAYFDEHCLDNSLLFKLYCTSNRSVVELIIEPTEFFWAGMNPLGEDGVMRRHFRKFKFYNISEESFDNVRDSHDDCHVYKATVQDQRAFSVDEFIVSKGLNKYFINLPIESFGVIHFAFESMSVEERITTVRQLSTDEWEYRDASTNALIDFYNPFG